MIKPEHQNSLLKMNELLQHPSNPLEVKLKENFDDKIVSFSGSIMQMKEDHKKLVDDFNFQLEILEKEKEDLENNADYIQESPS